MPLPLLPEYEFRLEALLVLPVRFEEPLRDVVAEPLREVATEPLREVAAEPRGAVTEPAERATLVMELVPTPLPEDARVLPEATLPTVRDEGDATGAGATPEPLATLPRGG